MGFYVEARIKTAARELALKKKLKEQSKTNSFDNFIRKAKIDIALRDYIEEDKRMADVFQVDEFA